MTVRRLVTSALAMGVALSMATARADDEKGKGAIKGVAKYDGPKPPGATIPVNQDPVCMKQHPKGITPQANLVFDDGTLPYVFVYVKSGVKGKYTVPAQPAVIDQKGCQYAPHVFGMQAGQKLQIKNSDPTAHNIHPKPKKNTEFNISQPKQGLSTDRDDFKKPEVMVEVKCDVHPWMSAYIGVLDHPFFATSGKGGAFEIKDLPEGDYEVEAWHEKWGTAPTQKVSIKNGEMMLNAKKVDSIEFKFSKKQAAVGGTGAQSVKPATATPDDADINRGPAAKRVAKPTNAAVAD